MSHDCDIGELGKIKKEPQMNDECDERKRLTSESFATLPSALKAKWTLVSDRPPFAALAANVLDRGINLELLPCPSVIYSRLLENVTQLVKSAGREVSLEWAERYLSYLRR